MADTTTPSAKRPRPEHAVRTAHTGAKHLLSNFDTFYLPPPRDQESRHQPTKDTDVHDIGFVSTTPVKPRWKCKDMSRVLKADQLEQHMDICLSWEGETILEVTTYRKPAGQTLYLKINRITQWTDGHESSRALYEPLLEVFHSTAKGEHWKADVLRIVYREDDRAWWHVQERMWRDRLRDPYKTGWKATERVGNLAPRAPARRKRTLPWSTEKLGQESRDLGTVSERKLPWSVGPQDHELLEPAEKRKRKLPWATEKPSQKRGKSAGSKLKSKKPRHAWTPGVDTVSSWFRSRGEVDPDDEEVPIAIGVKRETESAMRGGSQERD